MPLSEILERHDELYEAYPRMQFMWVPYSGNATLMLRSETDEDITGCWGEDGEAAGRDTPRDAAAHVQTYHDTSSCVDVSYKTLCDSYTAYEQRTLYTEQEMVGRLTTHNTGTVFEST